MNAVFENDVLADGPLLAERPRYRHHAGANVFNQPVREISTAVPVETDLRVPQFRYVFATVNETPSGVMAQVAQ